MARRVPKRFRRPVEREIQRSPIFNTFCNIMWVLLGLMLVIGLVGVAFDSLFITHLNVYDDNNMMDGVPSNLGYVDIPLKYKPNSKILVSADILSFDDDYDFHTTIVTDSDGKAILRYPLPENMDDNEDITLTFRPSDNEDDFKLFSIFVYESNSSEVLENARATIHNSDYAYDTDSYKDVNTKLY